MLGINGILPALVTPFDDNGKVDEKALGNLVDKVIADGSDGLYVCGSTGEAFMLSEEERKQVLATVIQSVNGRVPVIAHIGAIATDQAIRLAQHAQSAGATAISACAPFYYGFSAPEVMQYYLDVTAAVELPMICYNFPAKTGFNITPEMLQSLRERQPRVMGLKNTTLDLFHLERVKTLIPEMTVFNGYDEVFLSGLAAGADGAIGTTFNFMAGLFKGIYQAFQAGDMRRAAALQRDANAMIEQLVKYGVFPATKAILRAMGVLKNGCKRPFTNVDTAGEKDLMASYARYVQPHQ